MAATDTEWDINVGVAKRYQQDYFELLPEWTLYNPCEYKYLKQNIGCAIYGLQGSEQASQPNYCNNQDVTAMINYNKEQNEVIDQVYNKILELGKEVRDKEHVYYGLIYNVMFRPKNVDVTPETSENKDKPKSEDKDKPKSEDKDKPKSENKGEPKSENVGNEKGQKKPDGTDDDDDNENTPNQIGAQPVFKIKKYKTQDPYQRHLAQKYPYDTWYIDLNGRVYQSWQDYKDYNTLPKCTMVLPRDGIYQADPMYNSTEEYSSVWIEVLDSPANRSITKVLAGADKASNAIGLAGIALGAASFLTPIGPAALTAGLVASGANGLWTIVRSSQNLWDRSAHDESISIADKNAFPSWLGIAGSTVGLAASGGSMWISGAVRSGDKVGPVVRSAYNSLVVGNLSVSGVGILYQGYCMYEKYQRRGNFESLDILLLVSHVLFFGNAVVNLNLAGELIESTQGKILDDYKSNLRSKRMRKAFNRAQRNAAAGNTSDVSGNAEVIRFINNKNDMMKVYKQTSIDIPRGITDTIEPPAVGNNFKFSFANGKMTVNGTVLMDPRVYVSRLLLQQGNERNNELPEILNRDPDVHRSLKDVLLNLLRNMFDGNNFLPMTNIPTIADFEPVIRELQNVLDPENKLRNLFRLSLNLITEAEQPDFLLQAFFLVWKYAKANLRSLTAGPAHSFGRINEIYMVLSKIVNAMFEAWDVLFTQLLPAFKMYISECEPHRMLSL